MREVKFDVMLQHSDGEWINVEDNCLIDAITGKAYYVSCVGVSNYEGAVVRQYTGLKDKNGTEIYEGDLIKFKVLYERIGKVIISPTRLELFDGNEYWDVYEEEVLEVIGNIHQNPELLEESK